MKYIKVTKKARSQTYFPSACVLSKVRKMLHKPVVNIIQSQFPVCRIKDTLTYEACISVGWPNIRILENMPFCL